MKRGAVIRKARRKGKQKMANDTAPALNALIRAVRAQEEALSELAASSERQADTVAGIVLVLRALMDLVLDEAQRRALDTHLAATAAGDPRRRRRAVADFLLD